MALTRWQSQAVINSQTDHFGWLGTTIIFSLFLDFVQTQQEAELGCETAVERQSWGQD